MVFLSSRKVGKTYKSLEQISTWTKPSRFKVSAFKPPKDLWFHLHRLLILCVRPFNLKKSEKMLKKRKNLGDEQERKRERRPNKILISICHIKTISLGIVLETDAREEKEKKSGFKALYFFFLILFVVFFFSFFFFIWTHWNCICVIYLFSLFFHPTSLRLLHISLRSTLSRFSLSIRRSTISFSFFFCFALTSSRCVLENY